METSRVAFVVRRALVALGGMTTAIALLRIGLRWAERSPYAWMVIFLDGAAALILVLGALPSVVGARHAWRTRWSFVTWAVVSSLALLPAAAIAVLGWP